MYRTDVQFQHDAQGGQCFDFKSEGGETPTNPVGARCEFIFFPLLKDKTNSIWLIKQQTQRNARWHPDSREKQGLEVKQNRTWLKIIFKKTREGRRSDTSVEFYCKNQQGRLQMGLNGSVQWRINGYSGPVTPPVGTSPPVNKQLHTDMASCTPTLLQSVIGMLHTSPSYPIERGWK